MDSEKGISRKEQGTARPGGSLIVGRIPKEAGGKGRGAIRNQAVTEAGSRAEVAAHPSRGWHGWAGLDFLSRT